MAEYIPKETIAEIRDAADIVEVIGEYIQLKKQGKHYMGLCPFHGEKTPSFSVSEDKQLYHCFGCGAGGNVITFVMEVEQLSFMETLKMLADKKGIAVPDNVLPARETATDKTTSAKIEAHDLAARFYHHLLISTEQGKEAYEYIRQRGLDDDIISRFQIGFSPGQSDMLSSLLEKRGFDLGDMEEAGLIGRQESTWDVYDRFRNRVMFPIRDLRGYTVGFGGRVLGTGDPKYLNSPETSIFNKGEILYGMDIAKKSIRKQNTAVLFEGYMDVIAAYRAGVDNGVASLGTSLTKRQAQILRRNAERIIICFDGDNAGQESTEKSAEILEQEGLHVLIAMLPDNNDPDDYIRENGGERFRKEIIDTAVPIMSFKMQALKRNKNLQVEGEKLEYIEEVLKEITTLGRAVERDFYLRQLADEFSLSFEALKQEQYRLYKESRRFYQEKRNNRPSSQNTRKLTSVSYMNQRLLPAFQNAERMLLAHMMQDRDVCLEVQEKLGGDFNVEQHIAIAAYLYSYYAEGHSADPGAFIPYLQDNDLIKTASEIAMLDISQHLSENELVDYIRQIKNYPKWVEIEQKEQKMKEAEKRSDMTLAVKLASEIVDMKRALKK
ncbi:DNA primase [Alteribacillus iranensis]|uniref:DNA primase n=1 Tax=Alteribacillus iranensis TaxID=930128 RepID=A0A1I1ZD15_9BACI|nr:DNA primase [Alteribacillus iranensis]SFE29218.1 DNA primase [Alteribacillus iranensis]